MNYRSGGELKKLRIASGELSALGVEVVHRDGFSGRLLNWEFGIRNFDAAQSAYDANDDGVSQTRMPTMLMPSSRPLS